MKSPKSYLFILGSLILVGNLLTGCAEESMATLKTGNDPTPQQLLASLKAPWSGIKTYEANQQNVETIIGGGIDVPPVMSISSQLVIDFPNKKAAVNSSVKWSTTTNGSSQQYLIGDMLYSKTDTSGQTTSGWQKLKLPPEELQQTWLSYGSATRLPTLLDGATLSIVGTETLNGLDVYKTTLTPTMEGFFQYLGAPPEEVPGIINGSHGSKPEQIGVSVWVDKQTFLPVKTYTSVTIVSTGPTDSYTSMTMTSSIVYDRINQPANITLPAEALAAVDVTNQYHVPPTITITAPPTSIIPVPPPTRITITVTPTTVPSMDELKVVQIATIAAMTKGNGTVVEYNNEIIPAGGKTGADNDPGKYLAQNTTLKYTITSKGLAFVGAPIQVP